VRVITDESRPETTIPYRTRRSPIIVRARASVGRRRRRDRSIGCPVPYRARRNPIIARASVVASVVDVGVASASRRRRVVVACGRAARRTVARSSGETE